MHNICVDDFGTYFPVPHLAYCKVANVIHSPQATTIHEYKISVILSNTTIIGFSSPKHHIDINISFPSFSPSQTALL